MGDNSNEDSGNVTNDSVEEENDKDEGDDDVEETRKYDESEIESQSKYETVIDDSIRHIPCFESQESDDVGDFLDAETGDLDDQSDNPNETEENIKSIHDLIGM